MTKKRNSLIVLYHLRHSATNATFLGVCVSLTTLLYLKKNKYKSPGSTKIRKEEIKAETAETSVNFGFPGDSEG